MLFDRSNTYWNSGGKFEFADIVLKYNEAYYLLHVKRAKAKQLAHLSEQMHRSLQYLSSTLNKESLEKAFMICHIKELLKSEKTTETAKKINIEDYKVFENKNDTEASEGESDDEEEVEVEEGEDKRKNKCRKSEVVLKNGPER